MEADLHFYPTQEYRICAAANTNQVFDGQVGGENNGRIVLYNYHGA